MVKTKKPLIKLPLLSITGTCSVCGRKAIYGYSNRGWNRRDFCDAHRQAGEAYLLEISND